MNSLKQIGYLIGKEFKIEYRQLISLASVLLFLISASFVCYKTFININGLAWISLFWIIMIFAAINLIVKSYSQGYGSRKLWYYSYYQSSSVFISKLIYNFVVLTFIGLLLWMLMTLFFGSFIKDVSLYSQGFFFGILGLNGLMSFTASLITHSENNAVLMSVLALPLTLPIVLLAVKIHAVSFGLIQDTSVGADVLQLFAIGLLIMGMGILLFPNVWRA